MKIFKTVSRYIFGISFIGAGVLHFVSPGFYLKIMPPYLPLHLELVYLSGVIEIALGAMLLIKRLAPLAGWGLILLLIAIFPANIYAYQHQELIPARPQLHLLRLPLQGVLILWAYWYTRPDRGAAREQKIAWALESPAPDCLGRRSDRRPPMFARFFKSKLQWRRVGVYQPVPVVGGALVNDDGSERQGILRTCPIGTHLVLQREPTSHDPNAISLLLGDGRRIGHLPQETAETVAPLLDSGRVAFDAEIWSLEKVAGENGREWLECRVMLTQHELMRFSRFSLIAWLRGDNPAPRRVVATRGSGGNGWRRCDLRISDPSASSELPPIGQNGRTEISERVPAPELLPVELNSSGSSMAARAGNSLGESSNPVFGTVAFGTFGAGVASFVRGKNWSGAVAFGGVTWGGVACGGVALGGVASTGLRPGATVVGRCVAGSCAGGIGGGGVRVQGEVVPTESTRQLVS